MSTTAVSLRAQISALVRRYVEEQFAHRPFDPARDLVHYAGRVFDAEELCNLVDSSLDFFLTANRYAERFESEAGTVIRERGLPWHVVRLGCRVEYRFQPQPPRNGGEAAAAG